MKRKMFLTTLVIGIMSIFGLSDVNAEEATDYKWEEVYNKFVEFSKQDGITINKTDDAVNISLTNPTYGEYSMNMTYADNKLSYTDTRDLTKKDPETKLYYAVTDFYFYVNMIYAFLDVYKIAPEKVGDDLTAFGVTAEDGEEIVIEDSGSRLSVTLLSAFTIDLAEFDNKTRTIQNTLTNENAYKELLLDFDPFMESVIASDIPEENIIDKEPINKTQPKAQKTNVKTSNEKNPETGFSLPIVAGISILVIALGTFVILRKKNLFQNI